MSELLPAPPPSDRIDVHEAARILGCTPRQVRKMVNEERLALLQLSGRMRYIRSDCERLAQACVKPARRLE
jgi:hypothetical protein